MIVLIGGISAVGKTSIAKSLLTRRGIPYFSIDMLMMGMYRGIDNCGFTPLSPLEEIVEKIWPIVREMIKTDIENNLDYLFEGFQILPRHIPAISDIYRKDILAYFITFSEKFIAENYEMIKKRRSEVENRSDIEGKESMIANSKRLIEEGNHYNQKISVIERTYFEEREKIIQSIEKDIEHRKQERN